MLAEVEGVGTAQNPAVKFVNKYIPDSADVELGINGELTKELEGREIKENEFIFALIDSENKEISAAKNGADGKFKFTLNFTKAGTYNYTISEKNNGVAGVTYDESIFGVEIVIADKGGYLEADSIVYKLENQVVNDVVFKNTYTTPEDSEKPEKPETPEKPEGPQTGDNSNIWMWFALLFVSGCSLAGTAISIRKRKETEEN